MKTSKEMQLKILDRMKDNVSRGECAFTGIQYKDEDDGLGFVDEDIFTLQFHEYEYRIKPETIKINGVEIPVPLGEMEMKYLDKSDAIYFPCSSPFLFSVESRNYSVQNEAWNCIAYKTKEEAIEASKALFGIEG